MQRTGHDCQHVGASRRGVCPPPSRFLPCAPLREREKKSDFKSLPVNSGRRHSFSYVLRRAWLKGQREAQTGGRVQGSRPRHGQILGHRPRATAGILAERAGPAQDAGERKKGIASAVTLVRPRQKMESVWKRATLLAQGEKRLRAHRRVCRFVSVCTADCSKGATCRPRLGDLSWSSIGLGPVLWLIDAIRMPTQRRVWGKGLEYVTFDPATSVYCFHTHAYRSPGLRERGGEKQVTFDPATKRVLVPHAHEMVVHEGSFWRV